jgi:hypothetical protein
MIKIPDRLRSTPAARFGLGLLCAGALAAFVPAAAQAYEQSYCIGVLKGSGNWCGASGAHSWDFNQAIDANSGTVWVCERIWDPSVGLPIEQNCGNEVAYGPVVSRSCACYGAHVSHYWGRNGYVAGYGEA